MESALENLNVPLSLYQFLVIFYKSSGPKAFWGPFSTTKSTSNGCSITQMLLLSTPY